ncbi:MAG: hypothetical protein GXO92_01410 [FCB group bacterium]|nr:hypothetical protein [FCB group bacterium]
MISRVILLVLAFLLLGAHFLRGGNMVLVVGSVLVPLLLFIKKRWILVLVQWLAYFGALSWAYTTFVLVHRRIQMGGPWLRMLLILSAVTVITFLAGYLLKSDVVRKRYD